MQCANPEQTASLFSLVAYTFLDSIILKGSRVRRLGVDELPPLSDRDDASYLAKKGFRVRQDTSILLAYSASHPYVVSRPLQRSEVSQYVCWSTICLSYVYFRPQSTHWSYWGAGEECMAMSALIVIRAIAIFASPIGINRILQCVLALNESLAYADVKPLQLLRDRRR